MDDSEIVTGVEENEKNLQSQRIMIREERRFLNTMF
jgi:hypothetical protein